MRIQRRSRSTAIEIQVGSEFHRTVSPRDALTRVGSHPSCELRLSDAYAPPHLATIERKGGEFRLHNRSAQVMRVGAAELPADSSRPWLPGEEARLNAWVSMTLVDPEGEVRARRSRPDDEAATRDSSRFQGGRDVAYVLLSGLLMVFSVWLIVGGGPASSRGADAFSRLARPDDGPAVADGVDAAAHAQILAHIRQGRVAELRGIPSQTSAALATARDALLRLRRPDGSFPDPWCAEAFEFVRRGLSSR
jgi:hypothetical protein